MELTPLEQRYYDYMDRLSLTTLRTIGRKVGVPQATSQNKDVLMAAIAAIYMGKARPVAPSGRGAPVKQQYIEPGLIEGLEDIRREAEEAARALGEDLTVGSFEGIVQPVENETVYTGILEITHNGYGFIRSNNCQPTNNGGDVFVSASAIHYCKLREGDCISCTAKPRQKNDSAALNELLTVNGLPIGKYEDRPVFDTLTAQYAKEKIELSKDNSVLSLRVLDLFVPIGKGQRALIIAPPKAGKTTLLKDIARSISDHHKDVSLIVLLVDERPEEVTDIRTSIEGAEIVYSTFDEGVDHHVRAAALTLAHAKRLAEQGKDVVILLDSLTKLTRAYNYLSESSGKTLSGGLEASALSEPKRFFGAARNTVEAGSITILATVLVDTGSRMDDVIYEEFKGTGNADIFLSRDLAERRVFPAIDIRRSGTRKEELLLSQEEIAAVYKMRERGLTENSAGIIDMLKRTQDNAEFVSRLPEWIRIYKNI